MKKGRDIEVVFSDFLGQVIIAFHNQSNIFVCMWLNDDKCNKMQSCQ